MSDRPYAGPIRAVHKETGEVRGWLMRDRGEAWLAAHDDLDAWDIMADSGNGAWKLGPKLLPGPDGRVAGHIEHETDDQRKLRLTRREGWLTELD
ncbi:hypothetical protein [Amycolatopsis sp. NPDC051372]|uniref:hypothetical protein n=1 Tax=Amycolatopsis sp. NPDC051372 TaxID=3155669 RepID=UPI003432B19A